MKTRATFFSSTLVGTALTAFFASSPVYADDLLERLEAASEAIGAEQGRFYVSRVPELEDKLPSWEWDTEIREASACVLQGIEDAKGRAVAEAYVAGLERDAQREITSMTQLSDSSSIPAELQGDDRTIINLMQSCNTMDISAQKLKESGFWDALQDPGVMQRLVAD